MRTEERKGSNARNIRLYFPCFELNILGLAPSIELPELSNEVECYTFGFVVGCISG